MRSRESSNRTGQIQAPVVPSTMRGNQKIDFALKKKPALAIQVEEDVVEESIELPVLNNPPSVSEKQEPKDSFPSLNTNIASPTFDFIDEGSKQMFELSLGSSQFIDFENVYRRIYNSVIAWIVEAYDYGLKGNFVIEEDHRIVNKSGLLLLKELLNVQLTLNLKVKIVQDIYFLIRGNLKNALDIISEDFILVWILSEIETLRNQNNRPHMEVYIKTLGTLFKVSLENIERGHELILKCFNYLRQPLFDFNIEILGMLISGAIQPILIEFPENSDILTKNMISLFKGWPQALILNGLEGLKSRVFGIPESQGRAKLENINSFVVFFKLVEQLIFEKSLLCQLNSVLSPKPNAIQVQLDYKTILKSLFSTSIFLLLISWKAEKRDFVYCVQNFCLRVLDYVFNISKAEEEIDPYILELIECYIEAMHFCEGNVDLANKFLAILASFKNLKSKLVWSADHKKLETFFIDLRLIKYISIGQDIKGLRATFSSKILENKAPLNLVKEEETQNNMKRLQVESKRFYTENLSLHCKEWRKIWRNLRIYDGVWGNSEMFLQENQHFSPKPFEPDSRPFKLKVLNYQLKGVIRPLLKMIPFDSLDRMDIKRVSESEIKLERQISEKKFPLVLERALNTLRNPFKRIINVAIGKKHTQEPMTSFTVQRVKTLSLVEGKLEIGDYHFKFSAFEDSRDYSHICLTKHNLVLGNIHPRIWQFANIKRIVPRRFLMKRTAAEIYFFNGKSVFLNFTCEAISSFWNEAKNISKTFPKMKVSKFLEPSKGFEKEKLCENWIQGKIPNFEYILKINSLGSRNFHDLSQYFIVPWIFSELNNLETRDLTKSLGALSKSPSRISEIKEKFSCTRPPYHYGSHYSCPSIVLHFLLRLRPFAEGGIALQSGKFDIADRLLYNLNDACNSAFSEPRDYRELVPEFYYMPEMFLNLENFDYGILNSGKRVHNVALPLWCGGNPYNFVTKMRIAFERMANVGNDLPGWIDLMFGSKQGDKAAEESLNVFYPLTYEENYTEPEAEDKEMLAILETQISGFGQVPVKISAKQHKKKTKSKAKTIFNSVFNPKAFRPTSRNDSTKKELKESVFDLPFSACIYAKYFGKKIVLVRNNGVVQILQWNTSPNPPELGKLPFTLLQEKEVAVNFTECKLFNRLINFKNPPILSVYSGKFLLIGGFIDGSVCVEHLGPEKKKEHFMTHHRSTVTVLTCDPKERVLVMGSEDGEISFWKCLKDHNFKYFHSVLGRKSTMLAIDIHPSMPFVAIAYENGFIDLFNIFDGQFVRSFKNPRGEISIDRVRLIYSPLPSIVFSDKEFVFSYSINGQFLSKLNLIGVSFLNAFQDENGFDVLIISLATFDLKFVETPFLNICNTVKAYILSTSVIVTNDLKFVIAGTVDGDLTILWDSNL